MCAAQGGATGWEWVGPIVFPGTSPQPQAGLEKERQRRKWKSTKAARNERVSKGKQKWTGGDKSWEQYSPGNRLGTMGTLTAPQRHQCLQVDVISGSGWQPRSGCSYFQGRFCAMLNNIPCMAADRKMRRFLFDSPLPSLPLPPLPTPTSSGILSSINWPGKGVCVSVCVCVCEDQGAWGRPSVRLSSRPPP